MDDSVVKLPSQKVLASLLTASDQIKTKVGKINGDFGARLNEHAENGNLHIGAFNILARLNRMEERKRNEFLSHLLPYIDIARDTCWANGHCGDLVNDANASTSRQEEEDENLARTNAERLENGIKELDPPESFDVPMSMEEVWPSDTAQDVPLKISAGKRKPKGMPGGALN